MSKIFRETEVRGKEISEEVTFLHRQSSFCIQVVYRLYKGCLIIYPCDVSSCLCMQYKINLVQFSSVIQPCVTLCDLMGCSTPVSLYITISQSLFKFMSIELVMLSNHLILCCPLLLLPAIFLSIRIFSNESMLHIRWPRYWRFSISPSNEYSVLISFRIVWFDLLIVQGTLQTLKILFSNTTDQKHQFFGAQPSSQANSHIHM